jgi:hypothetical protein
MNNTKRKMNLKKRFERDKKGVSLMVSYVLLISIVITVSIVVFVWLMTFTEGVGEKVDCEDGTSIILESYTCNAVGDGEAGLKLVLKNNGLFNIDGIIIAVGETEGSAPTTYLYPDGTVGIAGNYYFKDSSGAGTTLEPGVLKTIEFKNKRLDGAMVNEIFKIQIQPFILDKNEKILCKDAIISQEITNCIIHS